MCQRLEVEPEPRPQIEEYVSKRRSSLEKNKNNLYAYKSNLEKVDQILKDHSNKTSFTAKTNQSSSGSVKFNLDPQPPSNLQPQKLHLKHKNSETKLSGLMNKVKSK